MRPDGSHVPAKLAFKAAPHVPLWVSKRGVCCLPHRDEGRLAPGLDSEHGWSSHRSHRWEIPLGQQTSEAEGGCTRFLRQSCQMEGRWEGWRGWLIISSRTESSRTFQTEEKAP